MNLFFILSCLLFFLHFLPVSLANQASMVHQGLDLKQAYERAKEVCPDKLIGKRYGHKVMSQKISSLMAPVSVAGDKERKTYIPSYVPKEERISKELQDMCGFSVLPQNVLEIKTLSTDHFDSGNEPLSTDNFDSGNEPLSTDDFKSRNQPVIKGLEFQSIFFFSFGLVVGMLCVFAYTSRLQATPVQPSKSLRRPEL
jgi:hypothetical protein